MKSRIMLFVTALLCALAVLGISFKARAEGELIASLSAPSVVTETVEGKTLRKLSCQLTVYGGTEPFSYTYKVFRDGEQVYAINSQNTAFSVSGEFLNEEGTYTVSAAVKDGAGSSVSVFANGYYKRGTGGKTGRYLPESMPIWDLQLKLGTTKTLILGESEEVDYYRWQYSDDQGKNWSDTGERGNRLSITVTEEMGGRWYRYIMYGLHGEVLVSESMEVSLNYRIIYKGSEDSQGIPEEGTKYSNEAYAISQASPVRPGYVFLGWAEEFGSKEVKYRPGDLYTKNANLFLYAVWEKTKTRGDINGDGKVNIFDVIRLLKFVTGETVEIQ